MKKKLKMKSTKTVTTTIVEEYNISKNLKYVRTIVNDEHVSNKLHYTGKSISKYSITPLWKPDTSMLKVWNPFWGENKELELNKDYNWFNQDGLPEPDDINIEDIIYIERASHTFFDSNLEPLPVVIHGDYIEANLNNKNYYLDKLKEHFKTHPNIVKCSDILNIPYYNAGNSSGTQYLDVLVYPNKEWLKTLYINKKSIYEVFTQRWDKNYDFLEIRQFMKPDKIYDEDED